MNKERWQLIERIYHAALEREGDARAAFLDEACERDEELRSEVEALIAEDGQAGSFIESPALEIAAKQMAGDSFSQVSSSVPERIGPYKLLAQLGRGGMGEVHLALDTRLNRKVAIKLLPDEYTTDPLRVRRFEQEARAASALNHPNILTIHEIGQNDSLHFIATEFIEGETLRQRMANKSQTLQTVLEIATQIASALAAAHAAGLIHRDIKPENIMVRPDGLVKVLDFGLAKLTEKTSTVDTSAPTALNAHTDPGTVLGTAQYMSPEQARGQELDARTDIFSLAVVLYEMIAGKAPFGGATPSDVISSILIKTAPPLSRYAPEAPAELERIVTKALEKDREERYQTVKDLQIDLKRFRQRLEFEAQLERSASAAQAGAAIETSGGQLSNATAQQATMRTGDAGKILTNSSTEIIISEIKRHKRGALAVMVALIVVIAGIAFGLYKWIGQKSTTPLRLNITRLTTTGKATHASISPDGKHLAYVKDEAGQQSLWLILVATVSEERIVPAAEVDYRGLTFSRDGNFIYYVRVDQNNPTGALYQKPVLGGEARKLLVNIGSPITLSPDSKRFAFVRGTLSQKESALMVANADGTEEKKLATREDPDSFSLSGPAWSPDGQTIACGYTNYTGGSYSSVIGLRVADGAEQLITSQRWDGWFGRVAWLSDGSGLVVTQQRGGGYLPQIWRLSYPGNGAQRITNDLNGYAGISLTADSGILAAVGGDVLINIWVAPAGDARGAKQLTTGAGNDDGQGGLDWTPDGRIVYRSITGSNTYVWIMAATDGSGKKQLTLTSRCNYTLAVSPDGRYLVWGSCDTETMHVWRMGLDGNNPKQLTNGDGEYFPHVSPDGNWVVYGATDSAARMLSLSKVPIDGGTPVRLTDKRSWVPRISPNGKLIACTFYDETTSQYKIAVIPFEGGTPSKISDDAGIFNRPIQWTPDGHAVAYIVNRGGVSNLWGQPLDGGPPRQLTDFKDQRIFNFAWSRDGKQLALSRGVVNSDVVLISGFKEK